SLYGSFLDIFWFNLFHEIGHLVLHGKKEKFIEFNNRDLSSVQDKEKDADKFASNELIPEKSYLEFLENGLTKQGIISFAQGLGVHPSIIAGRLCHDKKVKWNIVSTLRPRLKFVQ
ncbi:MAG: ImmA/IrrE family metallo-endopeptidase, partial [Patescibacteria group bacterium]